MNSFNPSFSTDKEIMVNANVDNILASLLSELEPQYINHIITDTLPIENRFRPYSGNLPNIVYSFEQHFKGMTDHFPGYYREIQCKREETYSQIVQIICNAFNITFEPVQFEQATHDYYTSAFYLYSFFVSDFTANLTNFFTNFIINEMDGLYESIVNNPNRQDQALTYSKKIFKNNKLALIHSNINLVINNICVMDIPLSKIIETVYYSGDNNRINYLNSIISENCSVFREQFVPLLQDLNTSPQIITIIKFALQSLSSVNIEMI